jgi:hypothetical protein
MEADPVFVPSAKTVSAPARLPSCSGSARARPAWQALPAVALAAAEPPTPCVPRQSLGTRRPQEQKP